MFFLYLIIFNLPLEIANMRFSFSIFLMYSLSNFIYNIFNILMNRYLTWINLLKQLLYPDKYKKYNPVKILTAQYHKIPNPKLPPKKER